MKTKNWDSCLPNKPVSYLSRDEVLEIHMALIKRFGGKAGVRDLGLLESALFRPSTGYYQDLVEMAAALFESLIMNHPFIDGNKRVAFFSTDVFMRINGYKIQVEAKSAHQFIIALLENAKCNYDQLLPWLRSSVVKL